MGKGPEYCKYPKLIMEKAKIDLPELIEKVKIVYGGMVTKKELRFFRKMSLTGNSLNIDFGDAVIPFSYQNLRKGRLYS